MPSQISLRTSPVLSSNSGIGVGHKTTSNSPVTNGMNAATRAVGSLLITHNSIIKPRSISISLNGSCGKAGDLDLTSTALFRGNGATTSFAVGTDADTSYYNMSAKSGQGNSGMPEDHFTPISPKTEGKHSNEESSLTTESNRGRLMCPELAVNYTGTLVGKRTKSLAKKQRSLENRVKSLQRKVRFRQLQHVHSHASRQLDFDSSDNQEEESMQIEDGSASSFTTDCSMEVSPEYSHRRPMPLPIQVDGASDDPFLPYQHEVAKVYVGEEKLESFGEVHSRNEDSFSSLESDASSEVEEGCVQTLSAQMTSLERLLDGEWTEESSDEEEEVELSADLLHRHDLSGFWAHSRSAVGSRWVWLQRRIAELNKQIYRLDHHLKATHSKEQLEFSASSPSAAAVTSVLPQYFSISNGTMLEHWRTSNGGAGLIAVSKHAASTMGSNGFSHHHPHHHHHPTGHAQCLPFLLPEALLGAKLQVKDLLSPSVERNALYVDESSFTAARTRALVRRVSRKVVRRKPSSRGRTQHADVAFHPHLSMAHELPSRIPVDGGLKQILSEHCYAQLPPLSKRHKAASTLPNLSTDVCQEYDEHYHSPSPSPVNTPLSQDSSRDGSYRRKNAPYLSYQASVESASSGPWSPGLSRPVTPNFTPLHPRKRRVASSTPLFDIDNIVIPYSVAASTRLERLEYKEIITPSWREVPESVPSKESSEAEDTASEDCNDQVFASRHTRCELIEKKRFLNFISGSQRKRGRPQSVTLSDSVPLNSPPPPPPRRLTIASPSPTYTEPELATRVHTVVLPWQPRTFPLDQTEQEALKVPPPPPPPVITHLSSPSLRLMSTPSQTPSCTSSALATPVGSPPSTPSEELPAEWTINPRSPLAQEPSAALLSNHAPLATAESALMASPIPAHNPIILKLTKKV